MTQEEKTKFIRQGSQGYRRYTSSGRISLNSAELPINTGKEEEICMKAKIGFGCGHIYNDIAGIAGYSYGLLYYTSVVGLRNVDVGFIFLIGHVIDAIAAVATGILVDEVEFRPNHEHRCMSFVNSNMNILKLRGM